MKDVIIYWVVAALLGLSLFTALTTHSALPDPALQETRYCGTPIRDTRGIIIRRSDVLAAFKRAHPCPATGLTTGACQGWQMDHIIPLACGGCDSVSNLSWMPTVLKAGSGTLPKDRWERKIYCLPVQLVPMPVSP
jgi:hypothetical protein